MNNREALLAGAKQCLFEKGYTRTTARDIAAASGVSLAAIGYHFRSTETLLGAALLEIVEDWDAEFRRALDVELDSDVGSIERFETIWRHLNEMLSRHRPIWRMQFEMLAQLDHLPDAREHLATGLHEGRVGLAELFLGIDHETQPEKAHAVGSFYLALVSGVLVQRLIAPERAPSAAELSEALKTIAGQINANDPA